MSVEVELFTASWCPRCTSAARKLSRIIGELNDDSLTFKVVDVLDELDRAVALGIVSTPAVAIDGELVFCALPAEDVLRERLRRPRG